MDARNMTSQFIQERSIAQIIICALTLLVIIMLNFIGNIAVFTATLTQQALKNQVSNMFIVNLCLADLGNALCVMLPSFVSLVGDDWLMGQALCDLNCALNYCFIIVSMMTLAGISIDRYVSVMYSLQYSTIMTRRKIKYMIAYIWIQAVAFSTVPVGFRWIHYDYWEVVCAIEWSEQQAVYYVIAAFIMCFLVPAAVMSVTYFQIVKTVKKNIKNAVPGIMEATVLQANKRAAKIINSLLIIVALFFISMTPFCVTKLLKVVYVENVVPDSMNLLSSWIQFSGSAVNPFVYGIFRKDFRRAFRIIWFKATCRNNMIAIINSTVAQGETSMQANMNRDPKIFYVKVQASKMAETDEDADG